MHVDRARGMADLVDEVERGEHPTLPGWLRSPWARTRNSSRSPLKPRAPRPVGSAGEDHRADRSHRRHAGGSRSHAERDGGAHAGCP